MWLFLLAVVVPAAGDVTVAFTASLDVAANTSVALPLPVPPPTLRVVSFSVNVSCSGAYELVDGTNITAAEDISCTDGILVWHTAHGPWGVLTADDGDRVQFDYGALHPAAAWLLMRVGGASAARPCTSTEWPAVTSTLIYRVSATPWICLQHRTATPTMQYEPAPTVRECVLRGELVDGIRFESQPTTLLFTADSRDRLLVLRCTGQTPRARLLVGGRRVPITSDTIEIPLPADTGSIQVQSTGATLSCIELRTERAVHTWAVGPARQVLGAVIAVAPFLIRWAGIPMDAFR